MLTRIRNANSAMFDTVKMPSSKLKENLAKVLEREGFIAGFTVSKVDASPATNSRSRSSTPRTARRRSSASARLQAGLRIYKKSDQMPKVLGASACRRLDEPRLMTDREARKAKLGGEVLCYVW